MVKIFALSTARIDRSLRSVRVIRCPLCVSSESVDLAGIAEGGFAPEQEKEGESSGGVMRLPVFRAPSQFATHRERFLAMAPSATAVAAATSKEVWYEEGRAAIHFT